MRSCARTGKEKSGCASISLTSPGDRLVGTDPLYDILERHIRDQRTHSQRDESRDSRTSCLFRDEKDDRQGDPDHSGVSETGYRCPESVHPLLTDMILDKQQDILIDLQQCLNHILSPHS